MDDSVNQLRDLIKRALVPYSVKRLLLFGSHATGDSARDSDYDFMIIVDDTLLPESFNELKFEIHKRLIEARYDSPVDLVVKYESAYEAECLDFGSLAYRVCREGVAL